MKQSGDTGTLNNEEGNAETKQKTFLDMKVKKN